MNTIRQRTSALVMILASFPMVASLGCATKDWKPSKIFSLDNTWPFNDSDEPEEGVPVRIVSAWTDTVLTKAGQKPQRGFGGRLMFYNEKSEKPILVDGQLVVYAFDESGRQATDNKPTRRYVFPADQMKLHMSKNEIGASYSFWLPWDEAGGPQSDISLISRFEPKNGPVVTSEQTRQKLPGAPRVENAANPPAPPKVPEGEPFRPARPTLESVQKEQAAQHMAQQASYEAPANPQPGAPTGVMNAGANASPSQMSVTSIALPDNFEFPSGAGTPQPMNAAPNTMPAQPAVQQQQIQQIPAQLAAPQPYQPPANAQPIYQGSYRGAQSPQVINGAPTMQAMQQAPPPQYNTTPATAQQRPATVGYSSPFAANTMQPIARQQFINQAPINTPGIQPLVSQTQPVVIPAQQQGGASAQFAGQPLPQQAFQQLPVASGVKTSVSYSAPPVQSVQTR